MRILLAIHNAYTDRQVAQRRACGSDAVARGRRSRLSCARTARFDARPPDIFDRHLASSRRAPASQPAIEALRAIGEEAGKQRWWVDPPLSSRSKGASDHVLTRPHPDVAERFESEQFLFLLEALSGDSSPICSSPMAAIRSSRKDEAGPTPRSGNRFHPAQLRIRGIRPTSDMWTTCSRAVRTSARCTASGSACGAPGLSRRSSGPRSKRQTTCDDRDFRQPSLPKGRMLFARLADTLGAKRPDIPNSGRAVGRERRAGLMSMPFSDFGKYPAHHGVAGDAAPGGLLCADQDSAGALDVSRALRPGGG